MVIPDEEGKSLLDLDHEHVGCTLGDDGARNAEEGGEFGRVVGDWSEEAVPVSKGS